MKIRAYRLTRDDGQSRRVNRYGLKRLPSEYPSDAGKNVPIAFMVTL